MFCSNTGVRLNAPNGKNDGTVDGIKYFDCEPQYGLFTRRNLLRPISELAMQQSVTSPGLTPTTPGAVSGVGQRRSSENAESPTIPQGLRLGDRVQVSGGRLGVIRYIGPTDFASGEWVGVELDEATGKNDGSQQKKLNAPSATRSYGGASVQALENLVREKEAHIEQLLQEFEMERAEMAKITVEREQVETEVVNQRSLISQLTAQIEQLQVTLNQVSEENNKLKLRVHEEANLLHSADKKQLSTANACFRYRRKHSLAWHSDDDLVANKTAYVTVDVMYHIYADDSLLHDTKTGFSMLIRDKTGLQRSREEEAFTPDL
ncbi:unnamed protein product [Dibothriocephalus latus]|uniref:CAP-Gly domain-containing protein n=1 Tax=Dibothriocephalus latus TaxID=60516 RepID=A0A3P6TGI4_DIBLA|nr:unnamed protein product [Dibothriocephalus latus]